MSELPVIPKLLCILRRVRNPFFTSLKKGKFSSPSGTPHDKRLFIISNTFIIIRLRKQIKIIQQKFYRLSIKKLILKDYFLI